MKPRWCGVSFAVTPLGAPVESAAELADGIEIALEVSKREIARSIVEAFFAGFAGRTYCEHGRFDRLYVLARLAGEAIQAVATADFEQARIALAVVQIPFQRASHGHDSGRPHPVGFFRKWV